MALTRCAAASCSTTGPPRSMVVRAAAKRWMSGSLARIQPVRSPAQCDLLREPRETTAGLNAASGVGATPSRFSSRSVSSATSTVPDAAAAGRGGAAGNRASAGRWGCGSPAPRRPSRAAAAAAPLLMASRSQPAGPLDRPTGWPLRTAPRGLALGARGHGHRHRPAARGPDRVERIRVARVLHQHLVPDRPARVRSTMFSACCAPDVTRICAPWWERPAAVVPGDGFAERVHARGRRSRSPAAAPAVRSAPRRTPGAPPRRWRAARRRRGRGSRPERPGPARRSVAPLPPLPPPRGPACGMHVRPRLPWPLLRKPCSRSRA